MNRGETSQTAGKLFLVADVEEYLVGMAVLAGGGVRRLSPEGRELGLEPLEVKGAHHGVPGVPSLSDIVTECRVVQSRGM